MHPSWTGFDTFNLDLRKTLPSLYDKAPVNFEQNAYYRSLMKFMSTRKVKFNYQVLMDIFVVGTIALFSLGGERYALKEFDFLLDFAEFVWVFRSLRSILRIASESGHQILLDVIHFRCFEIKGIDAVSPISITLFSNYLKS